MDRRAEALRAKAGGSPRICTGGSTPVLLAGSEPGLHCQSLQPRRKRHEGGSRATGRRSQACDGPDRHRCSRRVKWSARRVTLPLALAPEASASLLGYALKKKIPSAPNPVSNHYFDRASGGHVLTPAGKPDSLGKVLADGHEWTGMRVVRPLFRFGRPACVYQHLCPKKWSAKPKLGERRLESRAGIAPASAALQAAA